MAVTCDSVLSTGQLPLEVQDQRTNGPVNAHLISGTRIRTQHTNPK